MTGRKSTRLIRNDYCSNIAPSTQDRKLRRGRRRRSERLAAPILVQLASTSETGEQFLENSQTLTLSRYGASILSKQKSLPNQEMIIRRLDTGKETRVRIAGKIGDRPEGYVYAVEFVDPQANLWEIEFPSMFDPDKTDDHSLSCLRLLWEI